MFSCLQTKSAKKNKKKCVRERKKSVCIINRQQKKKRKTKTNNDYTDKYSHMTKVRAEKHKIGQLNLQMRQKTEDRRQRRENKK